MSVGVALLAHQNLGRAAELVQALHASGCKIAIHVDAKTPEPEYDTFFKALSPLKNVVFARRIHCEWGRFSLVEAQLAVAEHLLHSFEDVSHVLQISGSCLPNRPLSELTAFLARNKDVDFIESVLVGGKNWIKGGLEAERFSLYFPLSFVKHKRRFDALVWLQRRLRIRRTMPKGLVPHIGSQWWALTRKTLTAIIEDPKRRDYDRFFKKCWIPDESYFQTLARKHSQQIKSRSLTYSRFDFRGKPMVFYDDHSRFIEHLDSFFVRKVWSGAKRLYADLLSDNKQAQQRNPDIAVAFQAQIDKAESRWLKGREGLFMQGRAPRLIDLNTAAPYTVLSGFDLVFADLAPWIKNHTGIIFHENLWSKNKAKFAKAGVLLKHNMASGLRIRDNNAEGFLLNFIWNHSDDDPIFGFNPDTSPSLAKFIANDANARVLHIRSAWLLQLQREAPKDIAALGPRVQALAMKEQTQLEALQSGNAKVRVISLSEIYGQPGAVLEDLIFTLRLQHPHENRALPPFLPHDGLESFVERLKDSGLNLDTEFETTLLHTDNRI